MSKLIVGKVCLTKHFNSKEYDDVKELIKLKVWPAPFGIRFQEEMSFNAKQKYPDTNYRKQGYIPFEIVDEKESYQCEGIFIHSVYSDKGQRIESLIGTKLPNIQCFFEELMEADVIESIVCGIADIHNGQPFMGKYEIRANEFCRTIMSIKHNFDVPFIIVEMVK